MKNRLGLLVVFLGLVVLERAGLLVPVAIPILLGIVWSSDEGVVDDVGWLFAAGLIFDLVGLRMVGSGSLVLLLVSAVYEQLQGRFGGRSGWLVLVFGGLGYGLMQVSGGGELVVWKLVVSGLVTVLVFGLTRQMEWGGSGVVVRRGGA